MRVKLIHVLPAALLVLTACNGGGPSEDASPDKADQSTTAATPSASSAPAATMPTTKVCGKLDLSGLEQVAGGKPKVDYDIGAGEAPPYGGPPVEGSICELGLPKGTVDIHFTPLDKAQQSPAATRRFLQKSATSLEAFGGTTCDQLTQVEQGDLTAYDVRCTKGDTVIVTHHVPMGSFVASCTGFNLPVAQAALARKAAVALCTAYTDSL